MIRVSFGEAKLNARGVWLRIAELVAGGCGALAVRAVEPTAITLPSCGEPLGLPCIFCGMTRALHHLLNGELSRALYFNWLVFPAALLFLALVAKVTTEIFFRRRVVLTLPQFALTRGSMTVACAALVVLWSVQVSLAVSLQKRELLNPRGVLYGLFVR